jgi:hypothetical protein
LRKGRLVPYAILTCCLILWVGFFAVKGPVFAGVDTFIFRDPGCNCALGRGLVSQSVPDDAASIPPQVFADYTPGAPLLFAPAAAIFGCTTYTDTYYNLLLVTLIAFSVVWYFPSDDWHRGRRNLAALLAGITLPGGLFLTDLDRPEALALVIFFALLMAWKKTGKIWLQGVLAGCSGILFLIQPYVGIVSFLLFLLLLASRPGRPGRLKTAAIACAAALIPVAIWIAALHHADPTAIHRFIEHAMGAKSGVGVVLKTGASSAGHAGRLHGYATAVARYTNKANRLTGAPLASLLLGFLAVGIAALRWKGKTAQWSPIKVGLCLFAILFLFPALAFPSQPNYFAASNGLLFAMAAIGGYEFSEEMRRGSVTLVLLAIVALCSVPALMLRVLNSAETKVTYLHAVAQAARVEQEFRARGYAQPRLLMDSEHYFVYKPYFQNIYNIGYVKPGDSLAVFDGLVRCYTGQMANTHAQLSWGDPLRQSDWELIDGDAEANPITLFGHRVQRRNWSWTCDVYARRGAHP